MRAKRDVSDLNLPVPNNMPMPLDPPDFLALCATHAFRCSGNILGRLETLSTMESLFTNGRNGQLRTVAVGKYVQKMAILWLWLHPPGQERTARAAHGAQRDRPVERDRAPLAVSSCTRHSKQQRRRRQ